MLVKKIDCCPICHTLKNPVSVASINEHARNQYLVYSKIKYNGFIDDWLEQLELTIDHCPNCGHYWYREQPDQLMLNDMYESGRPLHPEKAKNDRAASPKMIAEMSSLMRLAVKPEPKLLDYGSGFGRWARAAINVGFKVTAYEPSEERGVEKSEIDFTLVHDVADFDNRLFDVINLEQVLEHVPDPVELLKELRIYCTPDTIVRITVPNILRCPEGNNIWKEWPYNGERAHTMAPFEHLHGFTPNSLETVAIRAGFKSVNNLYTWVQYPKEMLRSYIGKLFPKFGQTFLLIKIDE